MAKTDSIMKKLQEKESLTEGAKFKVGDKVKLNKSHPLVKTAKRDVDLNKVYTIKSVETAFFGKNSIMVSEPYVYYFNEMKYNVPEGALEKAE